jgi:biotin carboxylase
MIKPVAIVLGGTYPHKSLLNNLKLRGYFTILIDYHENPPAKVDADEHLQESTLDKEKVLEIAKKRNASLVIAACIDHANVTACYVAEKLNLPVPYSYEIALSVTKKNLMKEKMVSNGIPTSKYVTVTNNADYILDGLKFPVIVKPTDSNSSKGVRKASGLKELESYVKDALEISRNGIALIEEFVEGKEIGADCYVQDNKVTILATREKKKININSENPVQQMQSSHCPADVTDEQMKKLKTIGEKIAEVFNLNNTPLLIQAIIEQDNINVIEFAPRVGGGENYSFIEHYAGFDIIDSAINSFLGLPVNLNFNHSAFIYADVFLYTRPNIFGYVKGYEELIKDKTIEYFHLFKVQGMKIGIELSSNNRIGSFMVKSKTKKGLDEKIKKSVKKLEVYDIHGNPVMRRDIYTN